MDMRRFIQDKRTAFGLWMLIAIISALTKIDRANNYLVFKYTFWHMVEKLPLYTPYPEEYADINHYCPFFGVLMTPFAILPDVLGLVCWHIFLTLLLYWAIRMNQFEWRVKLILYWFCAHELLTALFMSQFNVAIVAFILMAYGFIQREGQEKWSALAIALGIFTKIYGVVALPFILFTRHKCRFVLWLIIWSAVLFVLPMLFSSPEYIISQYQDWIANLQAKSATNLFASHQNISLIGMIRKIGYVCHLGQMQPYLDMFASDSSPVEQCLWTTYSDMPIILLGSALLITPLLRFRQWRESEEFRRMFMGSILMYVCLFSNGSESSTYIIAFVGVALWYASAPWQRTKADIALMVMVFVISSLSVGDLCPRYIRYTYIWPFALKALPVTICWLVLNWELLTKDFCKEMAISTRQA